LTTQDFLSVASSTDVRVVVESKVKIGLTNNLTKWNHSNGPCVTQVNKEMM